MMGESKISIFKIEVELYLFKDIKSILSCEVCIK